MSTFSQGAHFFTRITIIYYKYSNNKIGGKSEVNDIVLMLILIIGLPLIGSVFISIALSLSQIATDIRELKDFLINKKKKG